MGLLVSDVIERARSEYLSAGNTNQESWTTIDAAMDATQLTMSTSGRVNVPADTVLEAYDATTEMVLNSATNTTNDLTLQERGYLETAAAAHASGTRWLVDPIWPRQVLFNALKATISQLYGLGLYWKRHTTALTLSVTGPTSLPAGAKDTVGHIHALNGTRLMTLRKGSDYEVIYNGGTLVTDPPQIQFFSTGGAPAGAALRVSYKSDFTVPTALTDDLDTLGIPAALQHELAMAVASKVLMGRDVPVLDNQRVREALANAGIPIGTRSNVGRMLWTNFVSGPVQTERIKQLESAPVQIVFERA